MGRLLIISNRLPVTLKADKGKLRAYSSTGGLATGLRRPHEMYRGLWIGWPGISGSLASEEFKDIRSVLESQRLIPVELTARQIGAYYDNFCNGTLWPVFHYVLNRLPYTPSDFAAYKTVNELFCKVVMKHYRPGDFIWVHDYHLMLLPALLREKFPEARIGFFLHIPFPALDVLRVVPHHEMLLEGILGADVIGFHTVWHLEHFVSAVRHVNQVNFQGHLLPRDGRMVHANAFPMGVDAEGIEQNAHEDSVNAWVRDFRAKTQCKLLVGIDRLDYTKGIPRRLDAMTHLLSKDSTLRGKIQLIQVSVPSRTEVPAYQRLKRRIERGVGTLLGQFSKPNWAPIQYISRPLTETELWGLYRVADVMLVTPVRDGMNLVAKEFIAVRKDERGALVLSHLAGSAMELKEAELVNPYDTEDMAQAFLRVLTRRPSEEAFRMRQLRRRVFEKNVHLWASSFLAELAPEIRSSTSPFLS